MDYQQHSASPGHSPASSNQLTARLDRVPALAFAWRNRALLAGCVAFALALLGEQLARHDVDTPATDPALGALFVQLAALLVGVVAWVGVKRTQAADLSAAVVSALSPFSRLAAWREQLGAKATIGGVALALVLCGVCLTLLLRDFGSAWAPLFWLLSLVVLALAFAGLRPTQVGLLARDPGETLNSPISRNEWLLIGAIMLVATVLRLWDLGAIPLGPDQDEAARAIDARAMNQGQLVEGKPFVFFGAGWWGVPNAYFWLLGQSLKLFGDNLFGARMVHALAGIATVWVVYQLVRTAWSPRAGLIAAGLIAFSDFAIQFSRTAGESTITILTWAVCFYYLYKGLQTCLLLDFVWSGIAGGLTLYGYVAGKLLPVALALIALYLLLRWGFSGVKRYLPGLALLAVAALLVFAPNGLYSLLNSGDFTLRYNDVAIFTHAKDYTNQYKTDNWNLIVADQFTTTYAAFDVGEEAGPFYVTRQPVLPVPWAALWLLGTAYMLWRSGDARYFMLTIWLVGGLAGPALTTHTPTLQRSAALVPLLAILPALFIDRVLPRLALAPSLFTAPRLRRAFAIGLPVLLVGALGLQTVSFYFGSYVPVGRNYKQFWVARYVADLDAAHNAVYEMGLPDYFWSEGATRFLAPNITGRDLANPATDLPLLDSGGKDVHFLIFPSNEPYLALLQAYYPGGTLTPVTRPINQVFFNDYFVSAADIATRQQSNATYDGADGKQIKRLENGLGAALNFSIPEGLAFPVSAGWAGGIVAPQYGVYQFELNAAPGAKFALDGSTVLTVANDGPVTASLTLAAGLHQVSLAGSLASNTARISLSWTVPGKEAAPIAAQYLFNGPSGGFLGRWYLPAGDPTWFTAAVPPSDTLTVTSAQVAPVLGWHDLDILPFGIWTGKINAPTSGDYHFAVDGDPMLSIWIDGKLVITHGVEGSPDTLKQAITLAAGQHDLAIRVQARYENTRFEFYWQPPGQEKTLLSAASNLDPPVGAFWQPTPVIIR